MIYHPSVIDCEFPEDREASLNENGEEIMGCTSLSLFKSVKIHCPDSTTNAAQICEGGSLCRLIKPQQG